ncbi:hypothetical protein FCOIX_1999 [Fusarium coicis]|nr:hypothetical protein FCOIX_1999 [Fusarium coicis]
MSHYEAVGDSDGVSPPGTPLSEPDNPVSIIDTETLHEALEAASSSAGPMSLANTDMELDFSVPRFDPKSRSPGLRWWKRLGYMGFSVLIAGHGVINSALSYGTVPWPPRWLRSYLRLVGSDVGDLYLYDYKNPTKYSVEEHEHGVRYDLYGFADVLDSIELGGWALRIWGPNYDIIEQANTVNVVAMQLPRRWTGLIIVLLIIFVHFFMLAITVISFALHTEASILGEPWQAVSQVLSPETEEPIQERSKGATMADKYVKKWAKSTGRNVGYYRLVRHRQDQDANIQKRQTCGK